MIGKKVEVLVENVSKKGIHNQFWGKTKSNKVVVFHYNKPKNYHYSPPIIMGQLVDVQIVDSDTYTLYGKLIHVK